MRSNLAHQIPSLIAITLCLCCGITNGNAADNPSPPATALPDWVTTLPTEEGVLFGLGQAPANLGPSAHQFARNLAFGAIASQINVSIEQESELSNASLAMVASGVDEEGNLADRDYTEQTDNFLQKMKAKTAIPFLPGALVVEQQQIGDQIYVLARMPKDNFEKAALAKVADIDRLLTEAQAATPNDQTGIRLMRRAYKASVERQSLAVLAAAMSFELPDAPTDAGEIADRSGLLIEPLSFRVSGGEKYPALAETARAAADELGLSIAEDGGPARFEFKIVSRESVREMAGWQRATVNASIRVIHVPSGQALGQIKRKEDQASTVSEEEALNRAYDRLNDPIHEAIVARLFTLLARSEVAAEAE